MSRIIVGSEIGSYTFNPAGGTITLNGLATITMDKVLSVVNVTACEVIYSPDDTVLNATISSNVISPSRSLIDFNSSDILRIEIDYPDELIPFTIGGKSDKISNTVTTATSAYAANDNMGGVLTITDALRFSGKTAVLIDVDIWSKDTQTFDAVIDYWNASPTSGTYTDSSAQVIAGDESKWLGQVFVAKSMFKTCGTICRATIPQVNLMLKSAANKNVYATIQLLSTPTYTTTSGVVIKHGVSQD